MNTVLFLTSAYPYFPGEQFIEDEIGYWAGQISTKIVIVPMTASGVPRNTPEGIEVDLTLAHRVSLVGKLKSAFAAIISNIFWKEVRFIYASKGLEFRCYLQALRSVSNVMRIEKSLTHIHAKYENPNIAYCYWNDAQAYAAVLLKRAGLISKIISRAHGFDIYESRRPNGYMPLKRQFIGEIDSILAISNEGKTYLEMTYNALPHQVLVTPLGVPIPRLIASVSEPGYLNIVSISFCVPVKRIDKIIDAIAEAALQLQSLKITWTHIGDGPLLTNLKLRAAEKLTLRQVEWSFLGNKPNYEVKQYFEKNTVDIFINASESEGVPVSIMEAMSYGVPVIAPNVGGIGELVSDEYSCLLVENPSITDIAAAIKLMVSKGKKPEIRILAKKKIITNYSAVCNYKKVVKLIIN